jgi:hypothetical protein
MQSPVQITFRNIRPSATIEEWVRTEADKLDSFYNRVMACRVVIEVPHRHHRKGSPYHIRIDLTVPGEEIVVKREPSLSHRARQLGETEIKKHLEVKNAAQESPRSNQRLRSGLPVDDYRIMLVVSAAT